ncbi:hypothetical protein [Nocardia mikamii]|uniref:hypothetical protein n=1 Tax=Nocardia mikamii TaxID=508464 RepID=UPI0007A40F7E|nr:hypothetical protein [Nocardia mikamii]
MGNVFALGDVIEWWADRHGRPATPLAPDAIRLTGTVAALIHDRHHRGRVVAYLVTCRSRLNGTYTETVYPDLHHPTATL